MMDFASDIRFALRIFARRSAVPILVAALFALGVGLASGMWAVIDAAILRPLPYRDGHELVAIMEAHPQRGLMAVTPANFLDWADRVKAFEQVAGGYAIDVSLSAGRWPERVAGTKVTNRFFAVWGIPPLTGRVLQPGDYAGAHRVVVLGHAVWVGQFGSDPRIVGRLVHIDGEPYTVIGVMPAGFRTIGRAELWIPWVMTGDERRERRFHLVSTVARLHRGRSPVEAETELATMYQQLAIDYPDTTALWKPRVIRLRDQILGDSTRALIVLGGAVLVLVVVAWINVASLLLAWLPSRRREFLVRFALGASTSRVVQQLLLESLVWSTAGTVAGVAIATWFVQLFGAVGVSPALTFDLQPQIDGRVLLATAALLLLSIGVTAVGPCVFAVRRSSDLVPRRARSTGALGRRVSVGLQVALSVVLLSASAALLVGFSRLSRLTASTDSGTMTMEISRSEARPSGSRSNREFFDRLLAAVASRREVRAAAAASYVPPARPLGNVRFSIEGRPGSTEAQTALVSAVSAVAFRVLGTPLVRGRLIDERDNQDMPSVAVISATLAHRYWPDEDPIGHRLFLVGIDEPVAIIGVAGDVKQPLSNDPRGESVLYLSYQQFPWPFMTVMFTPSAEEDAAVAAVREEVARLDTTQAAGAVQPLDDLRTEWLGQPRLQTTVVTLFGGVTLVLTLVGLYARVAHSVIVRAREFAIRLAVGARPVDVVRPLTLETFVVTAAGVVAGLAVLPFSTRALRNMVFDMPRLDLGLAAGSAAVLLSCALASVYWPARRAGRVAPADLLKAE